MRAVAAGLLEAFLGRNNFQCGRVLNLIGWKGDTSGASFSTLHSASSGRPKHPMNAFFLYLQDERQSAARDDPTNDQSNVSMYCTPIPGKFVKEAAQRWRELSEYDKKPYLDRQKELQEVYRAQLESFNAIHSKEEKRAFLEDFRHNKEKRQKRMHKKQVQQTNPPKRSRSALAFYMSTRFSAIKVDSITDGRELLKDVIASWKMMFSHQKQPFYDRASEDKDRYEREMQEYMQKMQAEGKISLLPIKYQKKIASQERKERKMRKS